MHEFHRAPRLRDLVSLTVLVGLLTIASPVAAQTPNCPAAIPNDPYPDTAAINACLAGGGTVVLQDGGLYWIDDPTPSGSLAAALILDVDNTTLRGQGGTNWPILRAVNALGVPMLSAPDGTDGYTLAYLVFDGNLHSRSLAGSCEGPDRWKLSNVLLRGNDWVVHHVQSAQTLCSSAMEVSGEGFEIYASSFTTNGRSQPTYADAPWADGLTIWSCENGYVHDNHFEDNTDIGLIVGGGDGCVVEYNLIQNTNEYAFGGLYVGWFPQGAGNHAGSVYRYNTIESEEDQMAFGLIVGHEPWWSEGPLDGFVTHAGSVTHNSISGAVVNLAIDGIGGGTVNQNTFSNNQGTNGFENCSASHAYTAHYFGSATIQSGWFPRWYFQGTCGTWNTTLPRPDGSSSMAHTEKLTMNQSIQSPNGQYNLVYQSDGNLVLYNSSWAVIHNFATTSSPKEAVMQSDGNFVVRDAANNVKFSTGTSGNPGAYFVVQGDGNLVVYSLSGAVLWSLW